MYRRERFVATILLGMLSCLFIIPAAKVTGGEPFNIGTRMPAFTLKDQHGKEGEVNEQVRLMLFCKERKGNDIVGEALKETAAGYLSQHQTVFVADTSGMPRLIAKFVALPALRKKTYRVLIGPSSSITTDFPSEKDNVTLLYLNNLIIEKIDFVDDPASQPDDSCLTDMPGVVFDLPGVSLECGNRFEAAGHRAIVRRRRSPRRSTGATPDGPAGPG